MPCNTAIIWVPDLSERRRFRPAFWPTFATVLGALFLTGLGVWQVYRLHWKEHLLATIAARTKAPVVPLPHGMITARPWLYRHVQVRGWLQNQKEMYLFAFDKWGRSGFDLIVPLKREDGGYVLINRGWVPEAKRKPETRPGTEPVGLVTIDGVVQSSLKQGLFVPNNEVKQNLWFYPDAPEMAAAAGILAPNLFVAADASKDWRALPVGGQVIVDIPNHHLQYALIWFSLAFALVVIFVLHELEPKREECGTSTASTGAAKPPETPTGEGK